MFVYGVHASMLPCINMAICIMAGAYVHLSIYVCVGLRMMQVGFPEFLPTLLIKLVSHS